MTSVLDHVNAAINSINSITFSDAALYSIIAIGVIFTVWTGFGQLRALTHGFAVIRGKYDDKNDPGAINHFQALSTALSGTVGLGNIAGVALAITLGGPGAVLWMWLIGFLGMAIKMTEVTQAMLTRDTSDPEQPRGGTMYMLAKTLAKDEPNRKKQGLLAGICVGVMGVILAIGTGSTLLMLVMIAVAAVLVGLGWAATGVLAKIFSTLFCIAVLLTAATGGNMFQAYSVADISQANLGISPIATGIVLTVIVGAVILGGIHRIGAVTGRLVPLMCGLYVLAGIWVILLNFQEVPSMIALIIRSGLPEWAGGTAASASGPFMGAAVGAAVTLGLQRALFSSEAGWGSAPMAHAAAKTNEPVREGVVAGLEPFIDTIVVCTITAMVLLLSNTYNRASEAVFPQTTPARIVMLDADADGIQDTVEVNIVNTDALTTTAQQVPQWTVETAPLPRMSADARKHRSAGEGESGWGGITSVFMVVQTTTYNIETGDIVESSEQLIGKMPESPGEDDSGRALYEPEWAAVASVRKPTLETQGVWANVGGATLTAYAFDRVSPGLGGTLVTLAVWLFAISTIISWNYYGEQATTFAFGRIAIWPYRVVYCLIVLGAAALVSAPSLQSVEALNAWSTLGYGIMIVVNIPLMVAYGPMAMKAYHNYFNRMKAGEMQPPHAAPKFKDVVEGKDVE